LGIQPGRRVRLTTSPPPVGLMTAIMEEPRRLTTLLPSAAGYRVSSLTHNFGNITGSCPPLWSSGQRSGFDFRRYQIFWELVSLNRGPLNLVSIIEELLGRKSSGSGLENRDYGRGDPLCWPRNTLYPQKLSLTSPTRGGRSVGIVRSQTQVTEFVVCFVYRCLIYLLVVLYRKGSEQALGVTVQPGQFQLTDVLKLKTRLVIRPMFPVCTEHKNGLSNCFAFSLLENSIYYLD
jgi:hypothetical protein